MSLTHFLLTLASFLAGFVDSIAGGGGLIMIPALLLGGLPPQMAITTNKFVAPMGTGIALFNFIRGKKVIWKIATFGLIFTILGSSIGARMILAIDQAIVSKIILFLLPIAIIITLVPKKNIHQEKSEFSRFDLMFTMPLICFSIGFYDGFFGPGTGTLLVLAFSWFLHMNLVHASATAKVFNFVSNISALVLFIIEGKILYLFALPLVFANVLGGYLGSHLTMGGYGKTFFEHLTRHFVYFSPYKICFCVKYLVCDAKTLFHPFYSHRRYH